MRLAMARVSLHGSMVGAHTHGLSYLEPFRGIVYCWFVGGLCLKCFSLLLTEEISQVEHEPRPLDVNAIVRPPVPPIQC